jgi:hypothetical protein
MYLDWECVEDLMRRFQVRSGHGGELVRGGLAASAERGENGELLLHFTSNHMPQLPAGGHPGVIRRVNNEIVLEGPLGLTGVARDVTFASLNATQEETGNRVVQTFRPRDIELRFPGDGRAATLIDWIENLDSRGYHYLGERRQRLDIDRVELRFGEGDDAHILSNENKTDNTCYGALRFEFPDFTAWLDELNEVSGVIRPGRIVYRGTPSIETRRRFREVLGFALGNCLLHRGTTALDESGHILWTSATVPNPFGSRIFAAHAEPPAPVGANVHLIEQARLAPIVRALFDHYDELGFRALNWAYWHAVCAPIHIAPVHFGGAIEMLQSSYMAANPLAVSRNIVLDEGWERLGRALKSTIKQDQNLDSGARSVILSKIGYINNVSSAELFKRFMKRLNLNQGGADVAAWRRRHQAAHGHVAAPEDSSDIIRDTILLQTLLNRIVLRIADAADSYVDRFSVGHPIRNLEDGVPEQTQVDGVD